MQFSLYSCSASRVILAIASLLFYLQLSLASAVERGATARALVRDGAVYRIEVTDNGSGYIASHPVIGETTQINPRITIEGGGGQGGQADATFDGVVINIKVIDGGSDYTKPPVVKIESPQDINARIAPLVARQKDYEWTQKRLRIKQFALTAGILLAVGTCLVVARQVGRSSETSGGILRADIGLLKYVALAGVLILAIAFTIHYKKSTNTESAHNRHVRESKEETTVPANASPFGVWVDKSGTGNGDVYSRLSISPSGTFKFEVVDFTGDVKGGYSGRWSSSGRSLRFEWGGMADGGSSPGAINGPDSLTLGATTFHR